MASKKKSSAKKQSGGGNGKPARSESKPAAPAAKPAAPAEDTGDDEDERACCPQTPGAQAPCACCCGGGEGEDEDWDPYEPGVRPHYLFKVSGFVLITVGVIVAFGGYYVARSYLPPITTRLIEAHNDMVSQALIYGILLVLGGVLLKLYAVLTVMARQELDAGHEEDGSEWFLRHAALILAFVGGAVLVRGFLETRMVDFSAGRERLFVAWYTALYARKCVLSGAFFLAMAIFTQVYLLGNKLVRGTEFEADF